MKLLDILARDLKCWPYNVELIEQSDSGKIYDSVVNIDYWKSITEYELSQDFTTAKVARAEWQVAVDALNADKCEHSYGNKIGCPECGELNAPNLASPTIDWSKQPEGFPLWIESISGFYRENSGWHRERGDVFEGVAGGQWRACREGQFFTVHRKPEDGAVVWDGSGNPPVGSEIEALMQGIGSTTYFWQRAKVARAALPESSREILVFSLETTRPAWVDEFRPIRTDEQVAAEERGKAIAEMCNVFLRAKYNGIRIEECCARLYDANYRKQVAP